MPINIFPRNNGTFVNIDGREGSLGDGTTDPPVEIIYSIELSIAPAQISPNGASQVKAIVLRDGEPLVEKMVSFFSSNTAVGMVPTEDLMTDQSGRILFEVIGSTIGVTTISASMLVEDDAVIDSNQVTLMVTTQDAAENYDATGYGRVVLSVESVFANALYPKPQRLSHAEQIRKYPYDTGLSRMANYEGTEVNFIPAWMTKT